ncbi:MAG: hypothetical protein Kow0092_08460 [Deferrisomatales bacterium]
MKKKGGKAGGCDRVPASSRGPPPASVWGEGEPAESESKFRLLFESSPTAMLFWDGNVFVDCNPAALALLGYARKEELVGRHPGDLSPERQPDGRTSREKAREIYALAQAKGSHRFEWVHTKADGEELWVEVVLTALPIGGRLLFHTLWFDITERKRAEAEREEAREFLDSIVENIPDMIFVKTAEDLRFVRTNRAGEALLGVPRSELVGKTNRELFPKERADAYEATDREVLARGELLDVPEELFQRADGTLRVLHTKKIPLRGPDGRARFILRISEDITERKRAEERLRRQAAAIEQASEAVVMTDTEARIRYVNPAFERITGYSREEALGRNPRFLKSGRHDERFYRELWETLRSGRTWRGHFINKKKDGSLYEEDAAIFPLRDDEGRTLNYVAVKRDVTNEVKLERHLRQSQKMEALGTLAGGIAHDFNNILTPIIGYAQLLLDGIDGPITDEQRHDLERIVSAGVRAQDLVGQILTFARRGERERQPVRVGPIVKETLKFLRASLPATIELRQAFETDQDTVVADPTQIHQVLMNLLTNASQALGEGGGVLEVGMKDAEADAGLGYLPPELQRGSYLLLTVSDTGPGMAPEVLERIFEPFFTTKAPGVGTGLGLAVVHGIVEGHGGAVKVYSEPGQGTTFNVFLPKAAGAGPVEAAPEAEVPRGTERILFVDDEEAIAALGRKVLEGLGYRVEAATDGLAALRRFREDPAGFDLVVTDQTMPKITGAALAQRLTAVRPDIPVILCTGFAAAVAQETSLPRGVREVLRKPLTVRELGQAVRRVLDRGAGTG